MNSTDMKKWLAGFVFLAAGAMISINLIGPAQAGVADSGPIRTPKAINTGRITGIVVNPSPATAGSPVVVTIYGSGICPGVNLFIGNTDVQSIVTGPNVSTSVASANLNADFRSSGSVQSQLIVRSPTAPGKPYTVKAASRQCDGQAETKLEVKPSPAAQIPGPAATKAEQNVLRNKRLGAPVANEEKKSPAQPGVTGSGPISAQNALKQSQPLKTKPLTGGPSGNPTLGGIDRVLVTPLPATVGSPVKFTIQGWGKCTSVGISFGDSQQVYVLSDIDFNKPFEQTYIYRTVTKPGQPYVMRVAGRSTQPSPCTTQGIAYVDVRPVPVALKMPGSSVAKAQESTGANIGGLPGALKDSMVEARGAQKQGAIPKSPPPPPEVTGVWTAGVRPGEIVNVVGKNFGTQPGRVRLIRDQNEEGDRYLDITDWKDNFVQGRVPANYPARDTDSRALQVLNASMQGSNLWGVHSGVVIEEEAREVPKELFQVDSCGRRDECRSYGDSFGAAHMSASNVSFTGSSGTDVYSMTRPLANGWRLYSCRYGLNPPPEGVDGGIGGCEPGRTQDIKLSVRWFRDAGMGEGAFYSVVVVIVGPKGLEPW